MGRRQLLRAWRRFSKNQLSVVGLVIVAAVALVALFAPWMAPHPADRGAVTDFSRVLQPPQPGYWLGTDNVGRDVFSRVLFGTRFSLALATVVLVIAAPIGVGLGLLAGYLRDTWVDKVIMRTADVFLAVPSLILAMAVTAVLPVNVLNAMLAVTLTWWPWYARLAYGLASALRNQLYIEAARASGASTFRIIAKEVLPNSISPILTKMTLDVGYVILLASSLSFVGLGAQPPTPDLGGMVATGTQYMPDSWWLTVFPAGAIVVIVLGFNLLGDGLRDLLAAEEV